MAKRENPDLPLEPHPARGIPAAALASPSANLARIACRFTLNESGIFEFKIGAVSETATPFDTPHKMEELVHWLNKAINENSLHPLLIVAVFIVTFLAIHHFQDGNGRLSRIRTTLMLLRARYSYVPYASFESAVEENKELYYKALRRTKTTLDSFSYAVSKSKNKIWQLKSREKNSMMIQRYQQHQYKSWLFLIEMRD